jgi:formylglycine-generating enzyme required for sulfatase activity
MIGNVSQWCNDWYGAYSSAAQINPEGAPEGQYNRLYRVVRGNDMHLGSVQRGFLIPGERGNTLGFRIALSK